MRIFLPVRCQKRQSVGLCEWCVGFGICSYRYHRNYIVLSIENVKLALVNVLAASACRVACRIHAENLTKDGDLRWSSEMTYGGGGPSQSGLLGDFDGDGDVDFTDFLTFASNFGKTSG